MNKGISIYPSIQDNYLIKCEEYIKLSKKYGFNEVFTSIHLPEVKLNTQIDFLHSLITITKKCDMTLIADIGGNSIKQIIKDSKLLDLIKGVDYLRLDYGYDHEDIKYIHEYLNNEGFIINASIYNKEQSIQEVEFIRSLNADVRACHNFYPRVESGIDEELALIQKKIFSELNVPIYYYVPSHNNPRGPIYEGLPTIEAHRYLDISQIMSELLYKYDADGIIFSDNFYNEEEFKKCNDIKPIQYQNPNINIPNYSSNHTSIQIHVHTFNDLYDDIIYKEHSFRYDSNSSFLRSKTSRTMAEYSRSIEPLNCIERKAGYITIDNKLYERYSGELQVVLKDAPASEKINVVGYIDLEDIDKLQSYRDNCSFIFIKQ